MDHYRYTIVSGAPVSEIKSYLKTISVTTTSHTYSSNGWGAVIERIWIEKVGSLSIQRVEITFYGSQQLVHHQLRAFRLKFLSAGG